MSSVVDRDMGYNLLLEVLDVADTAVYVGIRQEKGAERSKADGPTLVEYATDNEYGSEDGSTPERSFLRSSVEENEGKYANMMTDAVSDMIDELGAGKTLPQVLGSLDQSFAKLGVTAVGDVQRKIVNGPFLPNSPTTIAKKGSSRPLIDTGRMRQSIDHEVRRDDGSDE